VQQRNPGKSGLLVSVIGLACNNFGGRIDLEGSRKVVHKALDVGITLLDVADV
jgi:aryl-alcohol dehydrogenase-like predicted oxidoreductase